jgi:hypothetical protein
MCGHANARSPRRVTLALLVAPDFLPQARAIVAALAAELPCREIPRPPECTDLLTDELDPPKGTAIP